MNEELLRELRLKFLAEEDNRRRFTEKYGHVRPPVGVQVEGKYFIAIDRSIYKQTQEGPYNFLNAIHDHCLHFFGEDFLDAEEGKPISEKHPAIQWLHLHLEKREAHSSNHKRDGFGAAWFRFAYDIFTIRDNSKLEATLRARLLESSTFQGARFELKVAAICATAGFDLEFEDEIDNTTTHPEFIGTDRFSGERIAVEAKSRHRHGILGFGAHQASRPNPSLGIRGLLLDAFRKHSKLPLYVFIDANLPPRTPSAMTLWEEELQQLFCDLEAEGYMSPCPANAVLVTNDPSHYVGESDIGHSTDALWARCYTSPNPTTSHPTFNVVERLLVAHKQRVAPPRDFNESS